MAIDSSIALGVKPIQLESPINQMAKMYEMQNAVQSNQLNKMKMDEYTRGVAEAEQFKNALAQSNDETAIRNAFYAKGDVKGYNDYLKSVAEQKKLDLEATNLGYSGQETQGKVAKQKQEFVAQAFRNIAQNPSNENITAWGQDAVLNKHFTLEQANGIVNQLTSMPVDQRRAFLASQGASAGELKPNIQMQNLGGTSNVLSVPAFGGAPTTLSSTRITADPGQLMTDARERERIRQGDRRDVVASTLTDAAGNVTQYNKFGELVGTKPNAGKPSATFEKTKAAKQQLGLDLDLAIKELTDATKKGGLIETATGSGAGALRDMGAGFFGRTTAGAEALGALQPIYDKVLKMVPRFEGPQSDKDTISYNKAAGDLGNPNAPTGKKLAAAKTILRLMKDRKAEFLTRDLAEGGAIAPSANPDVDALLQKYSQE
jgi:hypothetical protein